MIRIGSNAARFLLAGNRSAVIEFFTPRPRPFDAIEAWTEDTDKYTDPMRIARAAAIAAPLAALVTYVVDRFVTAPRLTGTAMRIVAVNVTFVFVAFLLGKLIKLSFASAVRRQVAKLDDQSALDFVLEQIAVGEAKNPARVPGAMSTMRSKLRNVLTRKQHEASRNCPTASCHCGEEGARRLQGEVCSPP